jgi:hypothetical protein
MRSPLGFRQYCLCCKFCIGEPRSMADLVIVLEPWKPLLGTYAARELGCETSIEADIVSYGLRSIH